MSPKIYTVSEVAEILKVNKNKVYSLINNGYLKAMKLGTIKITDEGLREFLDNSKNKSYGDMDKVSDFVRT